MKKISFIIPVYNVEKYLDKLLKSIISNNYKDYEIIIVNDESTDKTYDICVDYLSKYDNITVINEKHQGLSVARNNALKLATGDYIWFIDGDDFIEKNSLKVLSKYMESNYDIIVFNYNKVFDNKIIKINSFGSFDDVKIKYILSSGFVWNKICKKELYTKNPFPKNLIFEDLHVMPELFLKTNNIKFIDNYLYNYVQRKDSVLSTYFPDKIDERLKAYETLYKKLGKEYYNEIEYIFITNLLESFIYDEAYFKKKCNLKNINKYVKSYFNKYYNNKYLRGSSHIKSILKRIYFFLIYHNIFFLSKIYIKFKLIFNK